MSRNAIQKRCIELLEQWVSGPKRIRVIPMNFQEGCVNGC